MEELKNAIATALTERYGEIDSRGCYIRDAWLSTSEIFNLICDVINVNDDLFKEEENNAY